MSISSKPPSDVAVSSLVASHGIIRTLVVDVLSVNTLISGGEDATLIESLTPSVGVTLTSNHSRLIGNSLVSLNFLVDLGLSGSYFAPVAAPFAVISDSALRPKNLINILTVVEYAGPSVVPALLTISTNGNITLSAVFGPAPPPPSLPVPINVTYVI
jgi:hypothetical protein